MLESSILSETKTSDVNVNIIIDQLTELNYMLYNERECNIVNYYELIAE